MNRIYKFFKNFTKVRNNLIRAPNPEILMASEVNGPQHEYVYVVDPKYIHTPCYQNELVDHINITTDKLKDAMENPENITCNGYVDIALADRNSKVANMMKYSTKIKNIDKNQMANNVSKMAYTYYIWNNFTNPYNTDKKLFVNVQISKGIELCDNYPINIMIIQIDDHLNMYKYGSNSYEYAILSHTKNDMYKYGASFYLERSYKKPMLFGSVL